MSTKFTPGPWRVDLYGAKKYGPAYAFSPVGGCGCCNSPWVMSLADYDSEQGKEECDANAALIAAAPDLYEALREIVNSDMAMREEDEGRESPTLTRARAALAKAEGRQ